jgi:CPA2 family monovalent cation:H+ antiporter-2
VAGYAAAGRRVVSELRAAGNPVAVVENDLALYERAAAEGLPAIWGDAGSREVLAAAGITTARLLLLTAGNRVAAELALVHARRANPGIAVMALAGSEQDAAELRALGADAVIEPAVAGGQALSRAALARLTGSSEC